MTEGIETYAGLYDQILAGAQESRAGRPTVLVAMTTVDSNNDPQDPMAPASWGTCPMTVGIQMQR